MPEPLARHSFITYYTILSFLPMCLCINSFFNLLVSLRFLFSQLRTTVDVLIIMHPLVNTGLTLQHHYVVHNHIRLWT